MRKTFLVRGVTLPLLGLSALLVSSCASEYEPASPPPRDLAVAALLPTGAYTVTGGQVDMPHPISIEGYVDFGTLEDGEDCESLYTLRIPAENSGTEEPQVIEAVRAEGGLSWHRDVSDPSAPGEWFDNGDPGRPIAVTLFIPAILAGDVNYGMRLGAGTGELCSIPLMPRFMTVGGDGRLLFDQPRAAATYAAGSDLWGMMFVDAVGDAVGLTDRLRNEALRTAAEVPAPTWSSVLEGASIKMIETEEGFTLTLYKEDESPGRVIVEMVFVRTERRPMAAKDGVFLESQGLTFLDRLALKAAADPAVVQEYFPELWEE